MALYNYTASSYLRGTRKSTFIPVSVRCWHLTSKDYHFDASDLMYEKTKSDTIRLRGMLLLVKLQGMETVGSKCNIHITVSEMIYTSGMVNPPTTTVLLSEW